MAGFKIGRLIDHVHLRAGDLEASRRFYKACLGALGIAFLREAEGHFVADELHVDAADGPVSHVHLALQAADRAAGGRDNSAPGERAYHPGYHAAFLLDPDGNNIEAVHHGPAARSAPWVEVTPGAA
jgi:catechol 2,3-dioxygenase-like lactoylglutathione lyase family enzyme